MSTIVSGVISRRANAVTVTANTANVGSLYATTLASATSNVVLADTAGRLVLSAIPQTTLGYLSGVTSSIQAQLDSKLTAGGTSGSVTANAVVVGNSLVLQSQVASRALVLNATGNVVSSTVTSTELGYLSGATSSVQTQLSGKQATITGAATTIVSSDLTASRVLVSDASGKVGNSAVSTTTLGFLDATSSVQTQLDGKQATITGAASSVTSSDLMGCVAVITDAYGKLTNSTVADFELGYLSGVTSSVQTQLDSKAVLNAAATFTDLTVNGNLTVTGNTTTLTTEQLQVSDPVVVLNTGRLNQPTGLYMQTASSNVGLLYQNSRLELISTATAPNSTSYATGAYLPMRVGNVIAGSANLTGTLTIVPPASSNGYMCSASTSFTTASTTHTIPASVIDVADGGNGIFAGQLMVFVTNYAKDSTNKTGYAAVSLLKSPPDFDVVPVSVHKNVNLGTFDIGKSVAGTDVVVLTDAGCSVSWKFDGSTVR